MNKRKDYLDWDTYFMGIAMLSAQRSKDPSTQVGACIVMDKKVCGIGYNGMPNGCSDDEFPWSREASLSNDTKYPYVVHAELNAILNSNGPLKGATIYTGLFPCNECSKAIIQSGIKEVVYLSDKYQLTESSIASRFMLETAGVECRKMEDYGVIELNIYAGGV